MKLLHVAIVIICATVVPPMQASPLKLIAGGIVAHCAALATLNSIEKQQYNLERAAYYNPVIRKSLGYYAKSFALDMAAAPLAFASALTIPITSMCGMALALG